MTKQIGHSFLSINIVYHFSHAHCRYSDCYLFAKLHNNTQTKKEENKYLALFDKMTQELKKYLFLASFTSKTTSFVKSYCAILFCCECFNGKELTTCQRLPSCQICNLLDQEIADMLASPFLLYSKVGNIHCWVSRLCVFTAYA